MLKHNVRNQLALFLFLINITSVSADEINQVTYTTADNATIDATLYKAKKSVVGVVLGHGAVFDKESWSDLAKFLMSNGINVLAINFRGYGNSTSGEKSSSRHEDILAGVKYLKQQTDIQNITVLGASMGGGAAALAAIKAESNEFDRLILLSPIPVNHPELIKIDVLYLASKDEPMVAQIQNQFEQVQSKKRILLLDGNSHAQHIFKTKQGKRLTTIIKNYILTGGIE